MRSNSAAADRGYTSAATCDQRRPQPPSVNPSPFHQRSPTSCSILGTLRLACCWLRRKDPLVDRAGLLNQTGPLLVRLRDQSDNFAHVLSIEGILAEKLSQSPLCVSNDANTVPACGLPRSPLDRTDVSGTGCQDSSRWCFRCGDSSLWRRRGPDCLLKQSGPLTSLAPAGLDTR